MWARSWLLGVSLHSSKHSPCEIPNSIHNQSSKIMFASKKLIMPKLYLNLIPGIADILQIQSDLGPQFSANSRFNSRLPIPDLIHCYWEVQWARSQGIFLEDIINIFKDWYSCLQYGASSPRYPGLEPQTSCLQHNTKCTGIYRILSLGHENVLINKVNQHIFFVVNIIEEFF